MLIMVKVESPFSLSRKKHIFVVEWHLKSGRQVVNRKRCYVSAPTKVLGGSSHPYAQGMEFLPI